MGHSNASRYRADLEQLYVVGHSAGAYNVMMALAPEFLAGEGLSTNVIRAAAGLSLR